MTRTLRTTLIALLTTVAFLWSASPAAAQRNQWHDLRMTLVEGREVWFEMTQKAELSMASVELNVSQKQVTNQELLLRFKVTSVTESGGEGEMTIERVRMETPLEGGVTFDSELDVTDDGTNPLAMVMRPLVGKTLQLQLDPRGRITAIKGLEGMVPAGPTGALVARSFSPDSMKRQFTPIVSLGTGSAKHKIGGSWRQIDEMKTNFGMVTVTSKHSLRSVEDSIATIEIKGDVTIAADVRAPDAGIDMKEGSHTGSYRWDVEQGMLESMELDRNVRFDANRSGVSMTVLEKIRTEVRRVDAPDRK